MKSQTGKNAMRIISVAGLVKRYGKVQALKGISFSVDRGEIFALLGPNGSGKTTTLEILMGLRSFEGGNVEYFDSAGAPKKKLKIGPVFQTQVYYDNLRVRELIKYYGRFYRAPSTDIQRYLDMVNLHEKLDSQYKDLSGGQKQQLAIVLALVDDPDILLFDEPSNALDPQVRLKIWDLIRALKDEGKTIIFTTHYIEEAEALADRVSILSSGEIIITDKPSNIVKNFNENYNVELCFEGPVDISSFERFGFQNIHHHEGIYSFSVDAIDAGLLQSVKEISESHAVSKISIGKSSLQSVFVKITEDRSA
jgi:ABC-2 type transport system ATP-binding protein